MIYKEAYQYNTGEMVYTYDGETWYLMDNIDRTKKIDAPDLSRVAYMVK